MATGGYPGDRGKAEQIAGKKALQTAAAAIAERMLPKLVKK